MAHGYRWREGTWAEVPLLHDGVYGAMGGLISCIEDYSKYVAYHMAAWPPHNEADNSLLKPSSLREMRHPWNFSGMNPTFTYPGGRECGTVSAYGYGLGWLRDCEGREYMGHSGGQNAETSGLFADNFFDDYSLKTLKEETQNLSDKVGKIRRVQEIVPENQLRGTYRLKGEKGTLSVLFTLTPENRPLIQEFKIREETKP